MELLRNIFAIVETGALIATLIFVTRAMHEKNNQRAQKGVKGAQDNEIVRKTIAASYRNAAIFFFVYLALNAIRNYGGIFG